MSVYQEAYHLPEFTYDKYEKLTIEQRGPVLSLIHILLQISSGDLLVTVLAFIAVALASINIFGGFLVTRRMLKMFERSSE